MTPRNPEDLSIVLSYLQPRASFRTSDCHFKITRKYWDHLRDKIILGPIAYLKFPPFHGLVKASKVGTHPEKARFLFPILLRYVFNILKFRILESMGRSLELSTMDLEGNIW